MRLIQVTVPADRESAVERALSERDLDYFASEEVSSDDYAEIVFFPVAEEAVESVLDDLYEAGLSNDDHVVIIDTEADIFERVGDGSSTTDAYARIASAELQAKAQDLVPTRTTFFSMTILASVVATTGLLLDSAAVVVGSMVIAPLFGPAIGASVGTVINDRDLFRTGVQYQLLGLGVAIASATVLAWVMRVSPLTPGEIAVTTTPQIVDRLSPDVLSLVVALAAGTAGVLSLATGVSVALVGVMIAAALLPPAATVGIGLAWGQPTVALKSGVLLLVNVLAINLSGLAVLWYLGYRPRTWIELPRARSALAKRAGVLLVAIVVVSLFLANVTYANVQRVRLEDAIEGDVRETLGTAEYESVTLSNVKVVQDRSALVARTDRVIVTVGRPPDERYPGLGRKVVGDVRAHVGPEVPIDVRVLLMLRARGTATPGANETPTATPRLAAPARYQVSPS